MSVLRCLHLPPLLHVKHEFTYLYDLWSQYPSTSHRCQYYNLEDDRFKYTDGAYASAFDKDIPDFGFEPTGFPTMMCEILLRVNQLDFEEDVANEEWHYLMYRSLNKYFF